MDDYIDPIMSSLSSSQWEDNGQSSQRASWVDSAEPLCNDLLYDCGEHPGEDNNLEKSTIHSENVMGTGRMMFGLVDLPGEDGHRQVIVDDLSVTSKQEREISERSFSLLETIEGNTLSGPFGAEFNGSCTTETAPCALAESGSMKTNDSDLSVFPQSVQDSQAMSTVQDLWASSLPSDRSLYFGPAKIEDFGLQEQLVEIENNDVGNACIDYVKLRQMESFSSNYKVQDHDELNTTLQLPDFLPGKEIQSAQRFSFRSPQQGTFTGSATTMQCPQQLLPSAEQYGIENLINQSLVTQLRHAPPNNAGSSTDSMKARVRARRGQATDPHSIAERLRREKIAERMKNLQELVPNASKTDKASMLDEIIDYVKFLQLQVKVLSMSRLGAGGGGGVPLVTDIPAEESSSLLLGQEGYLQESQGTLESEKEVISLLESNVTMAMQYLQSKGLCLMPVALAAAISAWKGSSIAASPLDRRKTETTTNPVAKDGGVEPLKNTGSGIKQEDADNCSAPDAKDSKPRS